MLFIQSNLLKRATYRVPGLDHHLCTALARGHDRVPARYPCPAIFVPGIAALEPAAHAVAVLPWAAVSVPVPPDRAAEEGCSPGLISGSVHHPAAAAACAGQPDRPAEAELNAGVPAALDLSFDGLPVFPAEQVQALFVLSAAENARGLPGHAAGNDTAGCAASAAAPHGDTGLLYTGAGRWATVRALVQIYGSTGPIPCDDLPSHGPSADPSGAAHSDATRGSMQEADGSSVRGCAG